MATRYKVQQFEWGFRMYDSQTEQPAESDPLWQIQRVNTSTKEITYAASGDFTATWDNRATSETYS